MKPLPVTLRNKLKKREAEGALRSLVQTQNLIDFASNDYLGFARNEEIHHKASELLQDSKFFNGATGSRLLTGHSDLFEKTEQQIADYHQAETALIFNSGYDANLGVFSTLPQRGDLVLYDAFSHASIRDGLALGLAKSVSFRHNDTVDLEKKLRQLSSLHPQIWIVTEAVFSMDGDSPDWASLAKIARQFDCRILIDEAHATGVVPDLESQYESQRLSELIVARIVTFGKALGCHGAAVLGTKELKTYLVNFARSLIYTTALPPHTLATVQASYRHLSTTNATDWLQQNIATFKNEVLRLELGEHFLESFSAIQSCVIPGNKTVQAASQCLLEAGFDVRAIRSPTVPAGKERLRFCLHSFQKKEEMKKVLAILKTFIQKQKEAPCTDLH